MKVLAILALATAAVAAPANEAATNLPDGSCTAPQYGCLKDNSGWAVCQNDGTWKFAGSCDNGTYCQFNNVNKSPYCVYPQV